METAVYSDCMWCELSFTVLRISCPQLLCHFHIYLIPIVDMPGTSCSRSSSLHTYSYIMLCNSMSAGEGLATEHVYVFATISMHVCIKTS